MQLLKHKSLFLKITPGYFRIILITAMMIAESGMSLLPPFLAGLLAESLFKTDQQFSYRLIILLWMALLLFQFFISFFTGYLTGKTGKEMLIRLKVYLFNHIQTLPLHYFHESKHGKTLSLIAYDAPVLSNFINTTLISVAPLAITFSGALVCMFLIDPVVASLSCLLIPFFILTTKIMRRKLRPIASSMLKEQAELMALAEENLSSIPIVKSYTREDTIASSFHDSSNRLLDYSISFIKINSIITPLIKLLATSIILVILWVTAEKISTGILTGPELVKLMMYGMLLSQPVSRMASIYGQYQQALSAASRIEKVLEIDKESLYLGDNAPDFKGNITFSNIQFGYPKTPLILKGIDLTIKAGETVAILGENGAGKSTLASLLLRFYTPKNGEILIDQVPITSYSIHSLRKKIGLVQQQIILQNCSVKENILFGKEDADDEEIMEAAKAAHAYPFIMQLPDGFETIIGDRGVKLSGGQQQRLSLARALLKNPPILILDEATAMFDPAGEIDFIENCKDLFKKATVILITHRPASLKLAERKFLLEKGKLTEIK